jgi:asparagine synthase (glutamine-hydrolysing)
VTSPPTAALAVSVAPGAIGPPDLAPPDAVKLPFVDGTAWVVPNSGVAGALAFTLGPHDHDGTVLTGADLAVRLRDGQRLGDLEPPFGGMLVTETGAIVATDYLGMFQVYGIQGYGWAAISTSARLLARLAGAPLDTEALGGYRIIGHHLGHTTPYQGVTVLPRAHRWCLGGGTLSATAYPMPAAEPVPDFATAVRRGAAVLRDYMGRCLDEQPGLVMQLSGGLDSRMLLAAIPPARRRGLPTLTLASAGNPDAEIAARLVELHKLRPEVIDLEDLAGLDPAQTHRRVHAAAERSDGIGNPIAFAMLDWAESLAPRGPRITGFGGEIPRGFYYLGQRGHPRPTPALVDRLAKWRVFSLEDADETMFDPGYAARTRTATLERMRAIFTDYGTDWLSATDEFYLGERTRRWVGATMTGAGLRNQQHSPLLHPYFVAVARALPAADKRGSRFNAAVLAELDADLAQIPLDSGRPPTDLLARPPLSTARNSRDFTRKAARKARQRLLGRGNPTAGVPVLTGKLVAHWRANPDLLAPAAASGLIREPWLAALLDGTHDPSPATAGFLAALLTQQSFTTPSGSRAPGPGA